MPSNYTFWKACFRYSCIPTHQRLCLQWKSTVFWITVYKTTVNQKPTRVRRHASIPCPLLPPFHSKIVSLSPHNVRKTLDNLLHKAEHLQGFWKPRQRGCFAEYL